MKNHYAVALGKLGGQKTSQAKKLSCRINGKLGGRHPDQPPNPKPLLANLDDLILPTLSPSLQYSPEE